MTTYLISDLHIDETNNENLALLTKFLHNLNPGDELYILGDLFSLWLGDDLLPKYALQLTNVLRGLSNRNISVAFMHGNRDFLLGAEFCSKAKCQMLSDPVVTEMNGHLVLLTHGDLLCTKDYGYQIFRVLVQNRVSKGLFLLLPYSWRQRIAKLIQQKISTNRRGPLSSTQLTPAHPYALPDKYDVVDATVQKWLQRYQAQYIIHGHTHKPGVHALNNAQRIVLGDWTEHSAKIVKFTTSGPELIDLLC